MNDIKPQEEEKKLTYEQKLALTKEHFGDYCERNGITPEQFLNAFEVWQFTQEAMKEMAEQEDSIDKKNEP